MKEGRKIIFPAVVMAVSSYVSVFFLTGILFGYLGADRFCKKYISPGKIGSVYFNFGKWELHFHHWLMGASALFLFWAFGFFYLVPQIILGSLSGVIVHDFHTDKEWYRVFYRKKA